MSQPFTHTSGPRAAKIVLVGEAWGKDEAEIGGRPFVGQSGRELARMLNEAGIIKNPLPERFLSSQDMCNFWDMSPVLCTNVLALRPPDNNLDKVCVSKKETPSDYSYPSLKQGKYLSPSLLPELSRLLEEVGSFPRSLVIAFGNTACWALLRTTKISSIRGTTSYSVRLDRPNDPDVKVKVLPTFHPAAVLRNWSLRPVVVADLMKAKREAEFPEVKRPEREVLVATTLAEIDQWYRENKDAKIISVDIETGAGQIKCIGFASTKERALVISFVDLRKPDYNFWPEASSEALAWSWVRRILDLPAVKLYQNGLYDLQYIWRMGIVSRNCRADTMLLHHSLFPELQKGLGFLGSIYSNEPAWKLMRSHNEETKRDE